MYKITSLLSKLGKQKMGILFNLRLHCIWNTIFSQILMIFQLFVLDFIAWFSHPGLWKIRLKWPFFVIERQIFESQSRRYIFLRQQLFACVLVWSLVWGVKATAEKCLIFMFVFSLFWPSCFGIIFIIDLRDELSQDNKTISVWDKKSFRAESFVSQYQK